MKASSAAFGIGLRLLELARLIVRFNHVARCIVNANHVIIALEIKPAEH